MKYAFKNNNGRIGCILCDELGIPSYFSSYANLNKQCKIRHNGGNSLKDIKTKINIIAKKDSDLTEVKSMITELVSEMQDLKKNTPLSTINAPVNNTTVITQNKTPAIPKPCQDSVRTLSSRIT